MTVALEITATYMALNGAKFDTRFRYLTKDTVTPDFHLIKGPTLASSAAYLAWSFKTAGYSVTNIDPSGGLTVPTAPSNTATGVSS